MLSYADFHGYFRRLYTAYTQFGSLEDALNIYSGIPMEKLCAFLEVSAKSPQKKLNMFLRWMIRRDSEVDLGVWESFDRKDLIVPLDTHVCRVAYYYVDSFYCRFKDDLIPTIAAEQCDVNF